MKNSCTTPIGLDALETRLAQDLAWLELPAKSWVPPREIDGQRVRDVVVVGAGMAGLVASDNPDYKLDITASSAGIPYPDRLKEVQNGKFDALILPSNRGEQTVIEEQKLAIKASEPVYSANTYMLIHRSDKNKALADDVNRVLKELKDDGTMDRLSQKWFGEEIVKYMK